MEDMYSRTRLLLGDGMERLKSAHVCVFGCGGVGSYIIEALARAGVGELTVVDADCVSESNINRQLIATHDAIGEKKTDVEKARILSINPQCKVHAEDMFYTPENADTLSFSGVDFVADAIDTVTAKIEIISRCVRNNIPVISSMGTGNKLDPTRFHVDPIEKTSVCPLARVMRRELKARGISGVRVLWSDETPITNGARSEDIATGKRIVPGSVPFVPSVAGLIIAGEIIRFLSGLDTAEKR